MTQQRDARGHFVKGSHPENPRDSKGHFLPKETKPQPPPEKVSRFVESAMDISSIENAVDSLPVACPPPVVEPVEVEPVEVAPEKKPEPVKVVDPFHRYDDSWIPEYLKKRKRPF